MAIGHLDTGVDAAHPALQGRIAGFLYVNEEGLPEPERPCIDSGSHGTHTAGIISSVAPEARLYCAAVIEDGKVPVRLLAGLEWMMDKPIRILQLSLGIHAHTPLLVEALETLREKGVLTIAAIGNKGSNRYQSPGCYERVLSVGACHADGSVARFSGSRYEPGSERCLKPDVLAPGVDILSAAPGGRWVRDSGTSMACAWVAGVAAALWEAKPDATVDEVEAAIVRSASPLPEAWRHRCRAGIVDPDAALELLLGGAPPAGEQARPPLPSPEPRFVDPRLVRKLGFYDAGEVLEAIIVLGRGERKGCTLEEVITRCASATGSSPSKLRLLHQGTLGVIQGEARLLSALIEHPAITIAQSTELDLL
ncbi:S8 family peptidase [Archangium violaceum]|uniref:S8 family peptidase n=1 Tax=Archangium violaceum TaxID=83451 RepID=UPI0013642B10|nr:S8 family serine peptidase [Archangium violaceum]